VSRTIVKAGAARMSVMCLKMVQEPQDMVKAGVLWLSDIC
jgi:hypothetical protein